MDTNPDPVPQCLCAKAMPNFIAELVSMRRTYLKSRLLMSKAVVSDKFQNLYQIRYIGIDPEEAHNFCYTAGDLVAMDFKLAFGWSG